MILLEQIQRDLQDTSQAIARAERTVRDFPDIPSVLATLLTIRKRQERLQERFASAANAIGLEVCSYRIDYENRSQATITGVTSVLSSFQKVFTCVYDALLNGPKKNANWSSEVAAATSLGFGYTFAGSLGVMMTLPNERGLFGETNLDQAMRQTLKLISEPSVASIQAVVQTLGLPAVRQAHSWAVENQKAGFGANITWREGEKAMYEARIPQNQVSELIDAISSAVAQEEVVLVGELLHVNIYDRTFQMTVKGQTIDGTFSKAITEENPAEIPKKYAATLKVDTKVTLVGGVEQVSYFLVRLDDAPPPPRSSGRLLSP